MFHIVLVEPEIPQNTGNISRTCAVTGSALHLVHPLGFSINEKQLRRAGLDYWPSLTLYEHANFEDAVRALAAHMRAENRIYLLSTHAKKQYTLPSFRDGDALVFGKETAGLPKELLTRYEDTALRIPMGNGLRSLNLSNSVAIVLYEALRQNGFMGLL